MLKLALMTWLTFKKHLVTDENDSKTPDSQTDSQTAIILFNSIFV